MPARHDPFVRKLRHGARLSVEDEENLGRLAASARQIERGDIAPDGSEPRGIMLVLDGWLCRYKQLENGRRQITSLYLPGDLCEPFGAFLPLMDHTLAALTPSLVARISPSAIREAAATSRAIEQALWWDLLLSDAMTREHLVSVGRRQAAERLGHFFCEMHVRLGMAGRATDCSFHLPLTQSDLADLFGLSAVHVNRSLQELRAGGLVSLQGRRASILDIVGLRQFSMFDPAYLRFERAILG